MTPDEMDEALGFKQMPDIHLAGHFDAGGIADAMLRQATRPRFNVTLQTGSFKLLWLWPIWTERATFASEQSPYTQEVQDGMTTIGVTMRPVGAVTIAKAPCGCARVTS